MQNGAYATERPTPPCGRLCACARQSLNWREKLTNTWRSLNSQLSRMSEEDVLRLLNEERVGAKRVSMLERLHQRYNTLRVARERLELLKGATQ